jgi:hypothetical protein
MHIPTDALPTEGKEHTEQAFSPRPLVLRWACGEFYCQEAMKEKYPSSSFELGTLFA